MIDKSIFDTVHDQYDNPIKMATVVKVVGTTAEVKFDGEDTSSGKKYHMLASCSLANGDRVLIAKISGSAVILGSIKK